MLEKIAVRRMLKVRRKSYSRVVRAERKRGTLSVTLCGSLLQAVRVRSRMAMTNHMAHEVTELVSQMQYW